MRQLLKKVRRDSLVNASTLPVKQRSGAYIDIHAAYEQGQTELACVILRYIGFNTKLYEGLVKRVACIKGQNTVKKTSQKGNKPAKRKRTDSHAAPNKRARVPTQEIQVNIGRSDEDTHITVVY